MIQEHKELLIKDLSARLPYGVKLNHVAEMGIVPETLIGIAKDMLTLQNSAGYSTDDIDLYKPYLFPLSSMTEEQKENLDKAIQEDAKEATEAIRNNDKMFHAPWRAINWLNANHFDYRGLIPMGLAKDATGLNIY